MAADNNKDWLNEIASKAQVSTERVVSILDEKGIQPSPVRGFPRRLTIRRIAFHGYKTDFEGLQNIEFEWDELTPGLWAMVTGRCLRGKSSIMRIVQWMLRGRSPETLRDDVKKWLHHCNLRFSLDDTLYEVEAMTSGSIAGTLCRLNNEGRIELAQFNSDGDFEATMSDFFMREFGLNVLSQWRSGAADEEGKVVHHSWLSLSGAMFIGTNYSALLGDIPPGSGMTVPLMRMYLGLPWVSTFMAAKTAQQETKQAQEARERRRQSGQAGRERRRNEIQRQLDAKQQERDATPYDDELRSKIAARQSLLGRERTGLLELEAALRQADTALKQAELAYASDRKELQAHEDAEAAGAIFRMLEPSCCPRCDTAVTDERKRREQETHACSVCGEHVESEEEAAQLKTELENRVKASKAARDKARKIYEASTEAVSAAQKRIASLEADVKEMGSQLSSFGARQQLDLEVAALKARLEEASFNPEATADEAVNPDQIKILKATVEVTEKKFKATQEKLLAEVSEEIVRYARRFGMTNLTRATLKGNAQLHVITGGQETSYSKCTDGEKLRLKVATVLAMIRVAELRGVGRHPGMLMIDSPGAQELAQQDLDALISGLEEATKEFAHLQVFIASLDSPVVLDHVSQKRMRFAKGEAYLW